MKKEILIFGIGKIADVIHYYATQECNLKIAAFVVDEQYKTQDTFHDLPVVSFQAVEKKYSPASFDMFVAVGYHNLSKVRESKCHEAVAKGYNLISIVSPRANVPTNVIFGRNCFIMTPAIIHPNVVIGDNVFIWSGAMVGHHSIIKDNCWLTSCCNVSGNVVIGKNSFLAVNATVGHSVTIGEECFLGANSLVTKNLEDKKVVIAESSKPIRLDSSQFLRMSGFSNL
ncbi:hypothetical protein BH10BAC4_BH10BAC4_10160 [soil metagenome]